MLSKMRGEPRPLVFTQKPRRHPWRHRMTLCIAAGCMDSPLEPRIVACTDSRVETDSAGAHIALKHDYISDRWQCLLAGDISKAEDLITTLRAVLDPVELTAENVFDKINEASAKHKEKMCKRMIEKRLGISFQRFLVKGEHELTTEARNRTLYELEGLTFGCELILFGFIQDQPFPYIFLIEEDGEVSHRQNFGAIGTGSVVAEASLYQRAQRDMYSVGKTLYNVYEATVLAHKSNAPGVGQARSFFLIAPTGGDCKISFIKTETFKTLERYFKKYGPKPVADISRLGADSFKAVL